MICPECGKKMLLKAKSFSYNYFTKPKKRYLRKLFWCKKDDIWLSIETPSVKSWK